MHTDCQTVVERRAEYAQLNVDMRTRSIFSKEAVLAMSCVEKAHDNSTLPPWFVNAAVDEKTDKMLIPAMLRADNTTQAVIDPVTGEKKEHRHLLKDPATKMVWEPAMSRELEALLETGTARFIKRSQVPHGRKVAYLRVAVDLREHKLIHERARTCIGGDQVDFPGETTTRTVDLTTVKLHVGSTLLTKGAKAMSADLKNFYLETPMERFEHARMKASLIPESFMKKHDPHDMVKSDGHVHLEIVKGMCGSPQAGRLANDLLRKRLAPCGCHECKHTPGLWRQVGTDMSFASWADDFLVKYTNLEHAKLLVKMLRQWCESTED